MLFVPAFIVNADFSTFYGGEVPGANNIILMGPMFFYYSTTTLESAPALPIPAPVAVPEIKAVATTTTSLVATTTSTIILATSTTTTRTTTTTLLPEAKPRISIWFDNRLYNQALVDKGEQFIVSSKPKIKLEFKIDPPYALSLKNENYSMAVDNASIKGFSVQASQISGKVAVAGVKDGYGEIIFEYPMADSLAGGEHVFDFSAKSSGSHGIPTSVNIPAKVQVVLGELKLMDTPISFPSPYSPTKNKDGITLQYTLSSNADVEIYIFSISGELVKKISCQSGSEGGNAGLNKVKWNGLYDSGSVIGNGIYLGTIVAKNEGKQLAKLKINVFD